MSCYPITTWVAFNFVNFVLFIIHVVFGVDEYNRMSAIDTTQTQPVNMNWHP